MAIVLTRRSVIQSADFLECRMYLEGVDGDHPMTGAPFSTGDYSAGACCFWFTFCGHHYRAFSYAYVRMPAEWGR